MSDQPPAADGAPASASPGAGAGSGAPDATASTSSPADQASASDQGGQRGRLTGNVIIQAIIEGSPVVITLLAIFMALVINALLIVFSDPNVLHAWSQFFSAPGTALSATWTSISTAYSALFEGAIFSPATISAAFHGGSIAAIFYPLSLTAFEATPLILTGLSVAIAFRAGLFNIGAAGQFVGGAIVAAWLGFGVHLPVGIHIVVCVIGGFAGGAVLGWIVGELKARTGAHEVIVTIMLNYVMYNLLDYLLSTPKALQQPKQSNLVAPNIAANASFPHVGGPPPQANIGFLIALAAAVGVAWLLSRSTIGFQFRTVGANPRAARSAGISVERNWALVMLIAGGLAGLAAATVVAGGSPPPPLTTNTYGTYGFDGITVALLGRARPLGVVLAGLLFGALQAGGTVMQAATVPQVPVDIIEVIQALIVLFVAAPPLIRAVFRLRAARGGGMEAVAKGWNG
ncbi:MAG TPA: ABC transporter permease [Streptosporangiaceae bacterium]|nr:ABC transporter permease [Streptosporangiaceae bacterium]